MAQGEFYSTGYKPACLARLKAAGLHLPDDLFTARRFESASTPQIRRAPGLGPRNGAGPHGRNGTVLQSLI
jgi:hypothetical protein